MTEIGIYTFAEMTPDAATGATVGPAERLRDLMEEVELADQVGLDVFAVGEHHRPDFAVSAPAVVLAAAAARTKNIQLSSAVSVLSSDDPLRVFQQFATLDLLSGGRAEIMAGRGSFTESFPLFGYDLADYDRLFTDKLAQLLKVRAGQRFTRRGETRATDGAAVYPRPERELPIWIAVGGTPESVARAGTLGLPLAVAIIGGQPHRFAPLVELYREAGRRAGHPAEKLKVGINSHGFLAETSQQAADQLYPAYRHTMNKIGRERGWPPTSRAHFESEIAPRGALFVGSPQQVIDKMLYEYELFQNDRMLLQLTVGTLPHAQVMKAIELLGTEVAPVVRREIAKKAPVAADLA